MLIFGVVQSDKVEVETLEELVEVLKKGAQLPVCDDRDSGALFSDMQSSIEALLQSYAGACNGVRNAHLLPGDFLSLAQPLLAKSLHSVTILELLPLLLVKRQAPSLNLSQAEPTDTAECLRALNNFDKFLADKPGLLRFLDPHMVVIESTTLGGGVPAGFATSIATIPGMHNVTPIPDSISGAANWATVYTTATKEAALATITGIRARHPNPIGGGGAVAGMGPCRLMSFSTTGAGFVEL